MDAMTKSILGSAVGLGAGTLAIKSAKMMDKSLKGKVNTKDIIKNSADLMIGTGLLKGASEMIV